MKKSGGSRKSGGGKRTKQVTKKIITHRETAIFPYKSSRDISGKFTLNSDREKAMG